MGVPAFFRWLQLKFPRVMVDALEAGWRRAQQNDHSGDLVPDGSVDWSSILCKIVDSDSTEPLQFLELPSNGVDCSLPNPNGREYDNLYLDMNGIIHPCTHPEGSDAPDVPLTEVQMMANIGKFIDRIFSIVRPRKVLYLAIDGVAPRAKMNQQRSRRFRAAREARETAESAADTAREMADKGMISATAKIEVEKFDSNCITPGTPFMDRVARFLRYYLSIRVSRDPGWRGVKVILSDSNRPGEGEHKMMEFIRSQRSQPDYNPQTRHCICGLDADLIMLALGTHEPYFSILREEVVFGRPQTRTCSICGQPGHAAEQCQGAARIEHGDLGSGRPPEGSTKTRKPFVLLHIEPLREYLAHYLRPSPGINLPFEFDIERAYDDFIFLCFFVGNDFLPHLPTLEIREHAIDLIVDEYRRLLLEMGGFITGEANVNVNRALLLMRRIGELEDDILSRRADVENRRKQRDRDRRAQQERYNRGGPSDFRSEFDKKSEQREPKRARIAGAEHPDTHADNTSGIPTSNKSVAEKLKAMLAPVPLYSHADRVAKNLPSASTERHEIAKRKRPAEEDPATEITAEEGQVAKVETTASGGEHEAVVADDDEEVVIVSIPSPKPDVTEGVDIDDDTVRFGEEGWRNRYYESKFGARMDDENFFSKLRRAYVEGLVWVYRYYSVGCRSWTWFFPYHYGAFSAEAARFRKSDLDRTSSTGGGYVADSGDNSLRLQFDLNTPFRPFDQLMGVLPRDSSEHVPKAYAKLMWDKDSEIKDFYPDDWVLDMNGKKQSWLGVALLPFIDEARLLEAVEPLRTELSEEEIARDALTDDLIFVHRDTALGKLITSLEPPTVADNRTRQHRARPDSAPQFATGFGIENVFGNIWHEPSSPHLHEWRLGPSSDAFAATQGFGMRANIHTVCARYCLPRIEDAEQGIDIAKASLPGDKRLPVRPLVIGLHPRVRMPPRALQPTDLERSENRADFFGRGGGGRGRGRGAIANGGRFNQNDAEFRQRANQYDPNASSSWGARFGNDDNRGRGRGRGGPYMQPQQFQQQQQAWYGPPSAQFAQHQQVQQPPAGRGYVEQQWGFIGSPMPHGGAFVPSQQAPMPFVPQQSFQQPAYQQLPMYPSHAQEPAQPYYPQTYGMTAPYLQQQQQQQQTWGFVAQAAPAVAAPDMRGIPQVQPTAPPASTHAAPHAWSKPPPKLPFLKK